MSGRARLALVAAALMGVAIGLGAFTFVYAKGASYLTNDPAACANCHVMNEHYDAWRKSSHHAVAVCNDCHTPHDFVGKYTTKGLNGFWHSFYFTTGNYPDPLRITPRNREVTEHACRYCHQEMTDAIEHGAGYEEAEEAGEEGNTFTCVRCHSSVGHWVRD
ncbi:MAG TPA: cytochrome c nitrite reductase small subunit [Longimicrobium sp.]|nr:cytochrome c nitrite reductase small subunit [Longimicrobium sp.]